MGNMHGSILFCPATQVALQHMPFCGRFGMRMRRRSFARVVLCRPRRGVYDDDPHGVGRMRPHFEELGLTVREVDALHDLFCDVDSDGSGAIDAPELLAFLEIDDTPFARRIFLAFDRDGNGVLDFREFVLSIWIFCCVAGRGITYLAFRLFDRDGNGALDTPELERMLREL